MRTYTLANIGEKKKTKLYSNPRKVTQFGLNDTLQAVKYIPGCTFKHTRTHITKIRIPFKIIFENWLNYIICFFYRVFLTTCSSTVVARKIEADLPITDCSLDGKSGLSSPTWVVNDITFYFSQNKTTNHIIKKKFIRQRV